MMAKAEEKQLKKPTEKQLGKVDVWINLNGTLHLMTGLLLATGLHLRSMVKSKPVRLGAECRDYPAPKRQYTFDNFFGDCGIVITRAVARLARHDSAARP